MWTVRSGYRNVVTALGPYATKMGGRNLPVTRGQMENAATGNSLDTKKMCVCALFQNSILYCYNISQTNIPVLTHFACVDRWDVAPVHKLSGEQRHPAEGQKRPWEKQVSALALTVGGRSTQGQKSLSSARRNWNLPQGITSKITPEGERTQVRTETEEGTTHFQPQERDKRMPQP